jgi:serine/threonine protein kinase
MEILQTNTSIGHFTEEDINNFNIDLANPDEKLSNQFAKYYGIKHKTTLEDYLAIVFSCEFASNAKLIRELMQSNQKGIMIPEKFGLMNFVEYDVTMPVAIFKKNHYEIDLEDFVKNHGPLSAEAVKEQLLPTMLNLIEFAESRHLALGNINPKNIIISEQGDFVLNECFSNITSQPNHYTAPELVDCESFSLGKIVQNDLYSLGVTLYYAATGDLPWQNLEPQEYNLIRLKSGTKFLFKELKKLPTFLSNLIAALVTNPYDRLDLKSLKQSLQKNFNFDYLKNNSKLQNVKIYFNGKEFSNPLILAHDLFNNWDKALSFVQEESVVKYLLSKYGSNIVLENIDFVSLMPEMKLENILQIIDPYGPIRIQNFAIHYSALADSLMYSYINNQEDRVLKITKIIGNWQLFKKHSQTDLEYSQMLQNIANIFDRYNPMFGVERLLYATNPYLHCLSEAVINKYVLTLEECLIALENKLAEEEFIVDNHLIAFLADRLNVTSKQQASFLNHLHTKNELSFVLTPLLYLAKKSLPNANMKNLCQFLAQDLLQTLNENIFNSDTKSALEKRLFDAADKQDLATIVNIFSDNNIFSEDLAGFTKACKQMQELNTQIQELNTEIEKSENLIFYGQKVTVIFSYMICLIISLVFVI